MQCGAVHFVMIAFELSGGYPGNLRSVEGFREVARRFRHDEEGGALRTRGGCLLQVPGPKALDPPCLCAEHPNWGYVHDERRRVRHERAHGAGEHNTATVMF